jgi:hypothetical protein
MKNTPEVELVSNFWGAAQYGPFFHVSDGLSTGFLKVRSNIINASTTF